jgi:hypothetical protein
MANESLTDERLRELYERALAERGAPERARCASPEAILALVRREGAEERRLETLDHVMACDACRAEFELLRAIEQAGAGAGAARAPAARPWSSGGWRRAAPLALAASVLLAVGVGVWQQVGGRAGPEVERGAPDSVTLLAPAAGTAAGATVRFVWHSVPGARRYDLEVMDAGGAVVYATTTADTVVTVRDTARLRPATDYRWWVRATDDAGAQRASAVRRLRVRRE